MKFPVIVSYNLGHVCGNKACNTAEEVLQMLDWCNEYNYAHSLYTEGEHLYGCAYDLEQLSVEDFRKLYVKKEEKEEKELAMG